MDKKKDNDKYKHTQTRIKNLRKRAYRAPLPAQHAVHSGMRSCRCDKQMGITICLHFEWGQLFDNFQKQNGQENTTIF